MDSQTSRSHYEDRLTFREFLQLLRGAKWLVLSMIIVPTAGALAAAWLVPAKYDASILVSPVSDVAGTSQLGALRSAASEFSGLASLAGISLGQGSRQAESLAVLESEALTERYIKDNNILPILYANKWDPKRNTWRQGADPPTLWKANRFFSKHIRSVSTDAKTGLVTLTIRWNNAQLAAIWANGLVKLTNDYLRSKAIAEAQRNIAYLNEQAAKTDLVPVRQAISSLLQNQINTAMLARGTDEYAFKILDPAQAPERPAYAQKIVWPIAGAAAGLLLGVFFVLLRTSLK